MMQYNKKLKEERIKKGMTQEEIADKLKTSQVMIWRYESGKVDMTVKVFKDYCKILECSSDEILGLKKEEKL